ncbi:putative ATP-dependent RNA helicase DDX27 [Dissostichus eleginoides]|uniref:ATP-dependent RNA helicase DDX27 n=1 Tax=Dissostichus eleginoides TaxID=100907 RepID=A0AAD9CJE6_DISEL|nr:putative ATP-dependent RNA helicase DDX27 [Dissostichus eleginoides]
MTHRGVVSQMILWTQTRPPLTGRYLLVKLQQDLGLIGTLQDEDLSPEEPDTEPEEEVSESGLERGESPGRGAGARGENGRDTADSSRGAFREEKARGERPEPGERTAERPLIPPEGKKKLGTRGVKDFNTNFEFGERDILTDDSWVMADILKQIKNKRTATTLDQKIDKIRKKRKAEAPQSYSEDASKFDDSLTFEDMNLSRPILKQACVPVGLLGRDLCACAATGTGKTAAFVLPVLERLIYKPRTSQVTRVLILVPTRELGIQVHSVARQLAQFSSITTCLAVGGLDLKSQEAALRAGPDILIATPGRLIDHLHNTPTFELSHIEILILDEADRMLDEYFEEQMKEIIRLCAHNRQTMLFSATMTEEVKELAAVSLNKPIRIFVNSNTDVAPFLRQEFVRIRQNREGDREAVVAALLTRTFQDHVMCFTQTRKQAHRLHILLGLMGLKVGELHGELSQNQRRFKDDQIDILVATDVAARGLDIDGVKTVKQCPCLPLCVLSVSQVINFTMPSTPKHYVHRVGRTARAGKAGRSVSLVGESERRILKEVVKSAKNSVKARVLPPGERERERERRDRQTGGERERERQTENLRGSSRRSSNQPRTA